MTVAAREAKEPHRLQLYEMPLAEFTTEENVRSEIDKEQLADLVKSIAQDGVLVPLLVRENSEGGVIVVDGHRRLAAAKLVELKTIPAIIIDADRGSSERLQVVANVQRAELHPLDEARAYSHMVSDSFTVLDVAVRVGRSEKYVRQRLVFNNMIEGWHKFFRNGQLSIGVAFRIARMTAAQQKEMLGAEKRDVLDGEMTISQIDRFIQSNYLLVLKDAPFPTDDADLVPAAGPCTTCPKRTGNAPALFEDVKSEDTCTDKKCFETKVAAYMAKAIKEGAIKLTLSYRSYSSEKPKGLVAWAIAGKKDCPDTKGGVIVQNDESWNIHDEKRRKLVIGEVLNVCVNEKCKIHDHTPARSSSGSTSKGPLTPAEKKRRAEQKRSWGIAQLTHRKFTEQLFADSSKIDTSELRKVVLKMLDGDYTFRAKCVLLAKAIMGVEHFEGSTPSQKASDAQERLVKWASSSKAGDNDLLAFIVAQRFTPCGDNDTDKIAEMVDVASKYGVKAASIEKAYDAEHAPKPAKEPKQKKALNKAKK